MPGIIERIGFIAVSILISPLVLLFGGSVMFALLMEAVKQAISGHRK